MHQFDIARMLLLILEFIEFLSSPIGSLLFTWIAIYYFLVYVMHAAPEVVVLSVLLAISAAILFED